MSERSLDSTTLVQRLTLIGVSHLSTLDETPAHAGEIARTCARQVDAVDADVVGAVSEAEVTRALNELDAADLVDIADVDDRSPTGKGRPAYEPEFDAETLVEAFGDDDRLDRLLDRLDE